LRFYITPTPIPISTDLHLQSKYVLHWILYINK